MRTRRAMWICLMVGTVSIAAIGTLAYAQTDVRDPFGRTGLDRPGFRGQSFDPGLDRRPFVPRDFGQGFDDRDLGQRPFAQRDFDRGLDRRGFDEPMFDRRGLDQGLDRRFDQGGGRDFDRGPDQGFDQRFDDFGRDRGPLDLRDFGRRDFGGRTFERDFGGRRSLDRGTFSPRGLSQQGPGTQSGSSAGQSQPGGG